MDSGETYPNRYQSSYRQRDRGRSRQKFVERCLLNYISEFHWKFQRLRNSPNDPYFGVELDELLNFHDEYAQHMKTRRVDAIMRTGLPTLLFNKNVTDSYVVCRYLTCIDNCKSGSVWGTSVFLMNAMNNQRGCNMEGFMAGENTFSRSYLEFFLKHAKTCRLIIRGHRFTQLLHGYQTGQWVTSLLSCKPEAVLTLLQYDARLFSERDYWDETSQHVLALAMEFILFCGLMTGIWNVTLTTAMPNGLSEHMCKMFSNFRLLLRTIPNPHTATFRLADTQAGHMMIPPLRELRNLFSHVYPYLELAVAKPSSLKHACRLVIRRRLNDNWQLPDGIGKLELPTILQKYVNLLED